MWSLMLTGKSQPQGSHHMSNFVEKMENDWFIACLYVCL